MFYIFHPLIFLWSRIRITCRCVLPIFMISSNSCCLSYRAPLSSSSPGNNLLCISMATAMCIAVGNVSLELCSTQDRNFTWYAWWILRHINCQRTKINSVYRSLGTCPLLTWSLGCTGVLEPSVPPMSSMALLDITSFTFILVWVPEPVCQITRGKWSSKVPLITYVGCIIIIGCSLDARILIINTHPYLL